MLRLVCAMDEGEVIDIQDNDVVCYLLKGTGKVLVLELVMWKWNCLEY